MSTNTIAIETIINNKTLKRTHHFFTLSAPLRPPSPIPYPPEGPHEKWGAEISDRIAHRKKVRKTAAAQTVPRWLQQQQIRPIEEEEILQRWTVSHHDLRS